MSGVPVLALSHKEAAPWHPQSEWAAFVDAFREMSNPKDSEFKGLVSVFASSLDGEGVSDGRVPPLKNLIEQMAKGRQMPVEQTVACARILCVILEDAEGSDDAAELLTSRQVALKRLGAVSVMLKLVSCSTISLYKVRLALTLTLSLTLTLTLTLTVR